MQIPGQYCVQINSQPLRGNGIRQTLRPERGRLFHDAAITVYHLMQHA